MANRENENSKDKTRPTELFLGKIEFEVKSYSRLKSWGKSFCVFPNTPEIIFRFPLMRHKHTQPVKDSKTKNDETKMKEEMERTTWALVLLTVWQETDPPSKISTMLKKAKDREDFPLPVRPQIPTWREEERHSDTAVRHQTPEW